MGAGHRLTWSMGIRWKQPRGHDEAGTTAPPGSSDTRSRWARIRQRRQLPQSLSRGRDGPMDRRRNHDGPGQGACATPCSSPEEAANARAVLNGDRDGTAGRRLRLPQGRHDVLQRNLHGRGHGVPVQAQGGRAPTMSSPDHLEYTRTVVLPWSISWIVNAVDATVRAQAGHTNSGRFV